MPLRFRLDFPGMIPCFLHHAARLLPIARHPSRSGQQACARLLGLLGLGLFFDRERRLLTEEEKALTETIRVIRKLRRHERRLFDLFTVNLVLLGVLIGLVVYNLVGPGCKP